MLVSSRPRGRQIPYLSSGEGQEVAGRHVQCCALDRAKRWLSRVFLQAGRQARRPVSGGITRSARRGGLTVGGKTVAPNLRLASPSAALAKPRDARVGLYAATDASIAWGEGECGLRPDQVSGTPRISVRRINGTSPVCIPSPRSLRRASSTEVGPRSINRPVSCHVMHIRGPRHAGQRLAPAGRLTACPGLSDDRCRLTDTQATDAMEPPCHAGGDQSANGGRHAVAHHHRHRVATVRLRPEDRVRHDPCRRQAAQASRLGGCQLGRIPKALAPATDPSVGHPLRRLPVIVSSALYTPGQEPITFSRAQSRPLPHLLVIAIDQGMD